MAADGMGHGTIQRCKLLSFVCPVIVSLPPS